MQVRFAKTGKLGYIGLGVMSLGPWTLMLRHFFIIPSYAELITGSFLFLLAGSLFWFMDIED